MSVRRSRRPAARPRAPRRHRSQSSRQRAATFLVTSSAMPTRNAGSPHAMKIQKGSAKRLLRQVVEYARDSHGDQHAHAADSGHRPEWNFCGPGKVGVGRHPRVRRRRSHDQQGRDEGGQECEDEERHRGALPGAIVMPWRPAFIRPLGNGGHVARRQRADGVLFNPLRDSSSADTSTSTKIASHRRVGTCRPRPDSPRVRRGSESCAGVVSQRTQRCRRLPTHPHSPDAHRGVLPYNRAFND